MPAARSAAWCRRFRSKVAAPAGVRASNKSRHARACPGHPRFWVRRRKTWMAGSSPAMTSTIALAALALPINAMPMQCHDDARPDPVAHAVRPRTPRHHRSSPGRRASGSGARGASSIPLHPGRPARPGRGRLGPARLGPARLRLGLDDRGPLDIFWRFRSLRGFGAFRCIRSFGRSGRRRGLAASERQAPIASLSGGGYQNEPCNKNEFTHVCISP